MITLINYASGCFESTRKYSSCSAIKKGKVDKVIEYTSTDIDAEFRENNRNIFSYERGDGLWLWKPYLVNKAILELKEDDYLMYCDAGAFFINSVEHLIRAMETYKTDIMVFELPMLCRQFTKKETFELMEFHDYSKNQILASYFLCKINSYTTSFVNKWLGYCTDERLLSPRKFCHDIQESNDFYMHREDQSILSILCRKEKIIPFRDPSDYGDRPWQYTDSNWTYVPRSYSNSPYPKIILNNRKVDPVVYLWKDRLKTLLNRTGLLTEKRYLNKISK